MRASRAQFRANECRKRKSENYPNKVQRDRRVGRNVPARRVRCRLTRLWSTCSMPCACTPGLLALQHSVTRLACGCVAQVPRNNADTCLTQQLCVPSRFGAPTLRQSPGFVGDGLHVAWRCMWPGGACGLAVHTAAAAGAGAPPSGSAWAWRWGAVALGPAVMQCACSTFGRSFRCGSALAGQRGEPHRRRSEAGRAHRSTCARTALGAAPQR